MRKFSIIWLLPLLLVVCKSPYELIRTGPEHPALPKEAEVSVVPWSDFDKYDQIALVEVGEFGLEKRILRAKEAARQAGGDFIAPKLPADPLKSGGNDYIIQSFLVLKKKAPVAEPVQEEKLPVVSSGEPDLPVAPGDGPADLADEATDYSNLPRASFRMLLKEYRTLRGEKFRGSLYPVKFIKAPSELRRETGKKNHLLMLSSGSGKVSVLLIVPRNMHKEMSEKILSKKRLDFIYTPVTVYKAKYPVLDYIEGVNK